MVKPESINATIKSMRWISGMFPLFESPKDEGEKMSNALHLYSENAANVIEELQKELDLAVDTIYSIEDDLERGNDNDWAREHISEYKSDLEELKK